MVSWIEINGRFREGDGDPISNGMSTDGISTAKRGRPTVYTPEIAQEICERLAEGETLLEICRSREGFPSDVTVRSWALRDLEGFSAEYARARDMGIDAMAEKLISIANDSSRDTIETEDGRKMDGEWVARSRLRVDTYKWYTAKLAPKRYSDRLLQEHSGPDGGPLQINITNTDSEL